jgi:hypothetical protein
MSLLSPSHLTPDLAAKFTGIALGHVTREFPHKLDHVWEAAADNAGPKAQHPIFHGSFDWHSCVHGYWLLAALLRREPNMPQAAAIRALFDDSFTPAKVAGEVAYLARPSSRGFERPYGWGWLLKLQAELMEHPDQPWAATHKPLAEAFAQRFRDYLPLAHYPVRTGVHSSWRWRRTMPPPPRTARSPACFATRPRPGISPTATPRPGSRRATSSSPLP